MAMTGTRSITSVATWLYLVVTLLIQVFIARGYTGLYSTAAIVLLAATQVFAVALVYLRLKYETRSIIAVAFGALFFSVLASVLFLASLGH